MIKLFLLSFVFLVSLYANKVIYLNYNEVPQRVVKGEIFPITLKTLTTLRDVTDIHYEFSNFEGLNILTHFPVREKKGKYFYDTFYFQSTQKIAKLPDINATIESLQEFPATFIKGKDLNIIALNPKNNFSNIIAQNFELIEYKTTSFDSDHNIIIFVASANYGDLSSMHFNNTFKQGIESLSQSYDQARVIYFLIVDKNLEKFSFSYFNLKTNKFVDITIPIVVVEDSVTTQSDLKPKDQSKEQLKMMIVAALVLIILFFIIWKKRYIYTLVLLLPVGYLIYLLIPEKKLCIKEGTQIHLLPVANGTIFETTKSKITLLQEGSAEHFVKVQLKNERIGWIRDEDICSN